MKKQEFLNQLQKSLSGEVEQSVVNSTLAFYREYLNEEIKKGYSEAAVLAKLGDPRLLAKTIIETSDKKQSTTYHSEYEEVVEGENKGNYNSKIVKLPNWLFTAIIIILLLVLFSLAFTILRIFLPYILLALGAMYIYHWIRSSMS